MLFPGSILEGVLYVLILSCLQVCPVPQRPNLGLNYNTLIKTFCVVMFLFKTEVCLLFQISVLQLVLLLSKEPTRHIIMTELTEIAYQLAGSRGSGKHVNAHLFFSYY